MRFGVLTDSHLNADHMSHHCTAADYYDVKHVLANENSEINTWKEINFSACKGAIKMLPGCMQDAMH